VAAPWPEGPSLTAIRNAVLAELIDVLGAG
jgi:hypothetical protein